MPMPPFKGSITALITPFKNGKVDDRAFQKLVEWQIDQGTHGLVPCGTTGESPTLTHDEHRRVVELCVEAAAGRVPVIAGTGSNSTTEAVELTRHAMSAGADGVLVVTPYYNKPTQEGLYQHFRAVAEAASVPVIAYNVPSRTGVDLLPETVVRLARVPGIGGIKEATGDVERARQIVAGCPSTFEVLSGDDATARQLMAAGARGVISVTANVAPHLMHELCAAAGREDLTRVDELDGRLRELHQVLFVESNPIPTKWALAEMGLIGPGIRLPLTPLAPRFHDRVRDALQRAGVLH